MDKVLNKVSGTNGAQSTFISFLLLNYREGHEMVKKHKKEPEGEMGKEKPCLCNMQVTPTLLEQEEAAPHQPVRKKKSSPSELPAPL